MVKFSIPIPNASMGKGIALPVELYSRGNAKVEIRELDRGNVEEIFGYQIEDKPGESGKYTITNTRGHERGQAQAIVHNLAEAKLQIYVEADGNPTGNELKSTVGFALRCAMGRSDDFSGASIEIDGEELWGLLISGTTYASKRKEASVTIDQTLIENLKTVLQGPDSGNVPDGKLITIRGLLNSAVEQVGAIDVSCALFFSILESIYIQQSTSEIAYKLSMRLTKKLGKDYDFFKDIKDLYGKRSKVIHGSEKGSVFTSAEHEMIEALATSSILSYLRNPTEFNPTSLDQLIIG